MLKREERTMSRRKGLRLALGMASAVLLAAQPAFARSISLKDAGIGIWIFLVIGAGIILLQLIPAAILFFSFIGTTSAAVFGKKKVEEEAMLHEPETAKVRH
jgi:hypothetical protein